MLIEIKNRYSKKVIFSHEQENNSLKITLKSAMEKKVNVRHCDFSGRDFSGCDFSGCDFSGCDFSGSDLSGSKLRSCDLSGCDLSRCDLTRCDLRGSKLNKCDLKTSKLTRCDLSNSDLSSSDLRGCDLRNSDLRGCDLRHVIGEMNFIFSMQIEKWPITFAKDVLAIGCQQYTIEGWRNFSDDDISKMHCDALEWWEKWKDFIFKAIELTEFE